MTLSTQFITIFSMIFAGGFVAASLDTFERFFGRRNKRSWLEVIYQLGFWLTQAAFLFFLLYKANYGELRIYVFLAIVCGFAAYRALFQKLYLSILEVIIKIISTILGIVKKIVDISIIWPIKTIFFLIISLLILVYKIFLKGIILMFLVVFYPIRGIIRLIWRLVPLNVKNSLRHLAGFFVTIKNTIIKWKNRLLK